MPCCAPNSPPSQLTVRDDSALHAGHPGAASGGGHYHVTIVSERFAGASRVARHRMVYDALRSLFPHADPCPGSVRIHRARVFRAMIIIRAVSAQASAYSSSLPQTSQH
ncbi:hypothetical protein OJJOAM_000374 [Cupriavidus sp. H18C1]